MQIVRNSTEENSYTIDPTLYEEVMNAPAGSTLHVFSKRRREMVLTQAEVAGVYSSRGFSMSSSGHPVKVLLFPWHPLHPNFRA